MLHDLFDKLVGILTDCKGKVATLVARVKELEAANSALVSAGAAKDAQIADLTAKLDAFDSAASAKAQVAVDQATALQADLTLFTASGN